MKLTIITVNLNNLRGLEITLESLKNKLFCDVEWVVIDGDSTDGSVSLVNDNMNLVNCFVCEKDFGIFDAMNKGIALASGDYFYFLNSGDTLIVEDLKQIIRLLDTQNDLYAFNYFRGSEGSSNFASLKEKDLIELMDDMINHQSIIYSRSCFDNYKYDVDLRFAADYEHLMKLLLDGKRIEFVDVYLACYNEDGISSQVKNRIYLKQERELVKLRLLKLNLLFCLENALKYRRELTALRRSRIFKALRFIGVFKNI